MVDLVVMDLAVSMDYKDLLENQADREDLVSSVQQVLLVGVEQMVQLEPMASEDL